MSGSGTLPPGSLSDFGLDLSGHHPVSFSYSASLPNPELEPTPPEDLVFGGADEIHCSTCHDPHDDGFGRFLVKDNRFSALCITCHKMDGWATSAHATSNDSVGGIAAASRRRPGRPGRRCANGAARPATRRTSPPPRNSC